MKSNIIKAMLPVVVALGTMPAAVAQVKVPATQLGVLVYGQETVSLENGDAVNVTIPAYSRYKYAVSSVSWIRPTVSDGKLTLSVDANPQGSARTAMLTVRSNQGVNTVLNVYQPGWDVSTNAQASVDAMYVVPVRSVDACKSSYGKAESGNGIAKSYDGDMNTLYHSSFGGFDPSKPEQWPVLEYYFTKAGAPQSESVDIESITYYPRTSGGENGVFGHITVEVGTWLDEKNCTWTAISEEPIDLKQSFNASIIDIPEAMQKNIRGIRITVRDGGSNRGDGRDYASAAEIKFKKVGADQAAAADKAMFTDAVCSALKPGTTQAQVDKMTDPFYKQLAQMMLDGTYDATHMVSTHNAVKTPQTLANEWLSPGKCYDQTQGVTGVAMTPGKYVVLVDGIPASKGTAELRFVQWHGHEIYQNEAGDDVKFYFQEQVFGIHNGMNIIEVESRAADPTHRVEGDMMGLAYVNNFDDAAADRGEKNPVTVHIVGGLWNGMLTASQTNAENQALLDNAPYQIMDCVGSRVHSVWQTEALKNYAKGQYVKYVNVLDQIIMWEHRLLGLEKYDRVVENRTFTYVNYNYYMYQGGRGPTFMYDTQNRVCNPDNLIYHDTDAVWGLSHEWGHQHQMAGYFCWTGMAEVSNNIFSAYNVAHMGYPIATEPGRYPRNKWQSYEENGKTVKGHIQKVFLDDNYSREITPPSKDGETKTANAADGIVMSLRKDAAAAARTGRAFGWSDELKQFAINQPKYPSKRFASDEKYDEADQNVVNPRTALNAIEAYSGNNGELILGPYVNLMYYFEQHGYADLYPDFFEALRRNNYPEGSDIEKKGNDKYELLAGIFYGHSDQIDKFFELFPNSCWTTKKYINSGDKYNWSQNSGVYIMNAVRKLSRLTGYNLWPFFERYGVFTVCAIEQGDYGIQYYIMTDDMYDEFKADMDALVADGTLKQPSDQMLQDLMYQQAPEYPAVNIPNDRPLLSTDN